VAAFLSRYRLCTYRYLQPEFCRYVTSASSLHQLICIGTTKYRSSSNLNELLWSNAMRLQLWNQEAWSKNSTEYEAWQHQRWTNCLLRSFVPVLHTENAKFCARVIIPLFEVIFRRRYCSPSHLLFTNVSQIKSRHLFTNPVTGSCKSGNSRLQFSQLTLKADRTIYCKFWSRKAIKLALKRGHRPHQHLRLVRGKTTC